MFADGRASASGHKRISCGSPASDMLIDFRSPSFGGGFFLYQFLALPAIRRTGFQFCRRAVWSGGFLSLSIFLLRAIRYGGQALRGMVSCYIAMSRKSTGEKVAIFLESTP